MHARDCAPPDFASRKIAKVLSVRVNSAGSTGCQNFFCHLAVEAVSGGFADPLRAHQIAPAKYATHGQGVNKVRVGWTLAVRASFRHHRNRLISSGLKQRRDPKLI